MKREEKYFDYQHEADKYVENQERKGRRLLSVSYRRTSFFSFLMGIHGYVYNFVWNK